MYDLFETQYDLWDSSHNIYLVVDTTPKARVDLFVQNYPSDASDDFTRRAEVTADSWLNWVRETFEGTKGEAWLGFYEGDPEDEEDKGHIGMFLRNAVIYGIGMVEHYQEQEMIPQTPIETGTRSVQSYILRLTPNTVDDNQIGNSATELPATNIQIFGWLNIPPTIGEPYWLFVRDMQDRLVWVAAGAVQHNSTVIQASPETNFSLFAPDRPYEDADLAILIGE
jgi:hypothetical protein